MRALRGSAETIRRTAAWKRPPVLAGPIVSPFPGERVVASGLRLAPARLSLARLAAVIRRSPDPIESILRAGVVLRLAGAAVGLHPHADPAGASLLTRFAAALPGFAVGPRVSATGIDSRAFAGTNAATPHASPMEMPQ